MILSVDPGRVKPGISLWNSKGELESIYSPCFKAKSPDQRLTKIWEWINDEELSKYNMQEVILESNSIAAGKEVGCFMAGIFSSIYPAANIHFVSPIHVAVWASKFYNTQLTNIPRNVKKKKTKELMEVITGRDNLTFDEADSILNYFYWYNVKRDIRHRGDQPESNNPYQSRTRPSKQL